MDHYVRPTMPVENYRTTTTGINAANLGKAFIFFVCIEIVTHPSDLSFFIHSVGSRARHLLRASSFALDR